MRGDRMFASVYMPGCTGSVVHFASRFSPLVEEAAPDIAVLDIDGCELLFGRPAEIAVNIARAAQELGCNANVAVAGNPDAAIHAARWISGVTVIPPGRELKYLGVLPLKALQPQLAGVDDDRALTIFKTLELWGVRCFADFAALPEAGISERLGPDGIRLQELARGTSNRPLAVKEPEPEFETSIELDDPIAFTEPLSFVFAGLLNQLLATLQAHALATTELTLRLKLEDRTSIDRTLNLPFPTRDQKVLLRLLMLDIEANPPHAQIVAVSIKAEPAKTRATQNGLFQPLAPEPEKLELTIARITKLVGAQNIGSPEVLNTHRPGAFRIRKFRVLSNQGSRSRGRRKSANKDPIVVTRPNRRPGFRVFRPPLRAEVHALVGRPIRVNARSANTSRNINGKVVRLAGPWRTTGDWWAEDGWCRDEWDIAIGIAASEQAIYRIYHDLRTGAWFVEGMYD